MTTARTIHRREFDAEAPASSPENAADRVASFIRQGIRAGRYAPGQRLLEPDLIARLGVSRGTIRESLRKLVAEGLVTIELHRGASVRQMTKIDVLELNEIREVLEGHGARLAAQRRSDMDIEALRRLEATMSEAGTSDFDAYDEYNKKFHALILAAGGNRNLPLFVDQTRLAVFRMQFQAFLLSSRRIRVSRAEHAGIVEALIAADAPAAESLMRSHIRGSTELILSAPDHFFL